VIDLELVRVALIVAAAPEFEAALDRFALHHLPHFQTALKFDHALVDALNSWRMTKLFSPSTRSRILTMGSANPDAGTTLQLWPFGNWQDVAR
jgi:hypothetical protein